MTTRNISIVLTLALTACAANSGEAEVAELTADSTTSASDEGTLLTSAVDGTNISGAAPVTPDQVAAAISARAVARYSPAGCVTVTQSGPHVTMAFAGCVGPRGLRALNGTLELALSAGAGGAIAIDASAADFHIGESTLQIAATATYSGNGDSQSLAVLTHTTGVGGLGFAIEHDGNYTVTWDATCVSLAGAWSTQRGDASRSTTADISRCIDACPIGTVTRNTVRDRQVTLTFDGTATASWSSSAGRNGTFPLACGM